jgi:type II secretory pathway pseudopilin PulG
MELLDVLIFMVVVGGLSAFGVWLVRRAPATSEERMLRQYHRLIVSAARETRKGHMGEANVYAEAAERLLAAWKERANHD